MKYKRIILQSIKMSCCVLLLLVSGFAGFFLGQRSGKNNQITNVLIMVSPTKATIPTNIVQITSTPTTQPMSSTTKITNCNPACSQGYYCQLQLYSFTNPTCKQYLHPTSQPSVSYIGEGGVCSTNSNAPQCVSPLHCYAPDGSTLKLCLHYDMNMHP